jgi:rhodanese-related sulfurtransferase
LESEYQNSHIEGAQSFPLATVRDQAPKLDTEKSYVLYCDTGQRSSTAAFILSDMGLDVSVIEGGVPSS